MEHKENESILTLSRRKTNWEPGSKNSLINNVLRENNDVKFREMLFDPTGPDNTIPCTSALWRRVQYQLSMLFHLAFLLEKEFKRELYKKSIIWIIQPIVKFHKTSQQKRLYNRFLLLENIILEQYKTGIKTNYS